MSTVASMMSANFTRQKDSTTKQIVPLYEVRIEKGCGRKTDFMKHVEQGMCVQHISLLMFSTSYLTKYKPHFTL